MVRALFPKLLIWKISSKDIPLLSRVPSSYVPSLLSSSIWQVALFSALMVDFDSGMETSGAVKTLREWRMRTHFPISFTEYSFTDFSGSSLAECLWSTAFLLLSWLSEVGNYLRIRLSSSVGIERQLLLRGMSVIVSSILSVILVWWHLASWLLGLRESGWVSLSSSSLKLVVSSGYEIIWPSTSSCSSILLNP